MTFFSALCGALIHSTWQVLVVALISLVVRSMLRGTNERYFAALITLVAQVAWPLATMINLLGSPEREGVINPAPVYGWVPVLWLLGASLMLARVGGGLMTVSQWARQGAPVDAVWLERFKKLENLLEVRGVSYLLDDKLNSPVTVGFFKPLVFLPVTLLTSVPVASIEMLVAHELMHIRRRDYVVNIFQSVIEALLFFHPAMWLVSKWARDDRELCCDEGVVAQLGDAHGYASALLALAHHQQPVSAPALAATGGSLMKRIVRLLNPKSKSSVWSVGAVLLVLGAGSAFAITLRAATTPIVPVTAELKPYMSKLCGDLTAENCRPEFAGIPKEDRATIVMADLGEKVLPFEMFLNDVIKFPANQRKAVFVNSVSAALGTTWECPAFEAAWAGEEPSAELCK